MTASEVTSSSRIVPAIRQVLQWLVEGDFIAIEQYTHGVRLSASLLEQAVADYGQTLLMPPISAFDQLDVVRVSGAEPSAWSVRIDLWTAEEGRSDLTLECTVIDGPGALLAVEVDNLHVL